MQVAEALECLGGNGYVEESILSRLYREAPLYSIWEGSGNVICLDILRAITKDPASLDALIHELRLTVGANHLLDTCVADLESTLLKHASKNGTGEAEGQARRLAEKTALALQASLLLRHSSSALADAFCASRLGGDGGYAFGTLPVTSNVKAILDPVSESILSITPAL
jgi:putative acyl-CoA dehydrogenase